MGIYRRENGIYYLNKTINKRTYRLSLETKNYYEVKERYEMFCSKLFYNKMNNIKEIPLIMRESAFSTCVRQSVKMSPSIEKIYKDYLKIAKYNGIAEETIKVKEVGLTVLKQYNLEWDSINHDMMLEI